jgi:hydroxyacylglutathione hydrolase
MPDAHAGSVVAIPCLSDNFAYLVPGARGTAALIDAPEAGPILRALAERGWSLTEIWLTHHHDDHVQAVGEIAAAHRVTVAGNAADAARLPPLGLPLTAGTGTTLMGHAAEVIDVPGHTVGHVAFHVPALAAAFTADSLMALGCGRLFEGTPEQMWGSLSRLMALPDGTAIHQGHDYLDTNLRFARDVGIATTELDARAARIESWRERGAPMESETLAVEKATNPFLRAGLDDTKERLSMPGATDIDCFAELRRRRDGY